MNLKMNKSKVRSNLKGKHHNGILNKNSSKNVPLPAIKVKEEVLSPEEEMVIQAKFEDPRVFKVEMEEEEPFEDYINHQPSTPFHQSGPESSPSGSENSNSPSPSPPLDSCPSVATSVPTTLSPFQTTTLLSKATSPLILNGGPQTAKHSGGSIPQIFFIDSRPYHLLNQQNNHNNNELSSKELHHVQWRVLPPSQLQQPQPQPQQQVLCKQQFVLKPQQQINSIQQHLSKYSPLLVKSPQQVQSQPVVQQRKLKPQQKIGQSDHKKLQQKTPKLQQQIKHQQQQKLQQHQQSQLLQLQSIEQQPSELEEPKEPQESPQKQFKEQQKQPPKLKHQQKKEHQQEKQYLNQKELAITVAQTSQNNNSHEVVSYLECSENFDDTEEEEEEDNPLPLDESNTGGDSDYQPDQPCKDLESQRNESTPSNSQSLSTDCSIPNLLNDAGTYGFKILLDTKEDTLKTPTWLVSNITKKLYTNMNKPIPFRVILKKATHKKKFFLRAMAVFKYPMFLMQNVVRCPNHLNPVDSSNIDFPHPNHVIRADHPHAMYECSQSGRLSVVVPLDFPENMGEAIPVLLKFMCHNSCVGGISRRPMAVLLTLENNSEEVGRYTIDVRVCACPSRDVKTEEKQAIAKGLCKKSGHVYEHRRNRKRPRRDDESTVEDDDQIFYLPVRGTTLYNYLKDNKTMYLKHHPEYAIKYPDPPNDLHWKIIEEMAPQNLISNLGEEVQPPESPNSSSSSSSIKEKQQPVFVLYSKNGDNEPTRLEPEGEVTPEVKKSVLESLEVHLASHANGSEDMVNAVNIKKERFNGRGVEEEEREEDIDSPSIINRDFEFLPLETRALQQKSTKRKRRRSSRDSGVQNAVDRKHIKTKGNSSPKGNRHLSVLPMPEQSSKKGSLVTLVPLASNSECEASNFDSALQENTIKSTLSESTEESEKVMLAAQVLASHLGAHQIDK